MQEQVIGKAEQMLRAIGAQYLIKIGTFSVSTLAEPQRQRKSRKLTKPMGTYTIYLKPLLENAPVGEVITVPHGDFDQKTLMNNVRTFCNKHWGAETYIAEPNKDGTGIEVLRNS